MKFRIGDWVKLRAGSAKMEVIEIEGDGAICEWYTGMTRHQAWVSFAVMANANRRRVLNPVQFLVHSAAAK